MYVYLIIFQTVRCFLIFYLFFSSETAKTSTQLACSKGNSLASVSEVIANFFYRCQRFLTNTSEDIGNLWQMAHNFHGIATTLRFYRGYWLPSGATGRGCLISCRYIGNRAHPKTCTREEGQIFLIQYLRKPNPSIPIVAHLNLVRQSL